MGRRRGGRREGGRGRTDVVAEVSGLVDFDAEVWLDFADDFGGVVEGEVRVLGRKEVLLVFVHK